MVDFKGNELQVGDKVVWVHPRWTPVELMEGEVTGFRKVGATQCCNINHYHNVASNKVFKINP